jgi:putative ATP-dependent endonuclease of OLD family
LLLVEEIEAHLHAQAQLRLIQYFRVKENEEQLILTTHSITLGSKIPLENLFICKNDKVFPMGHDYTQLNQGDYKFLERFLDATKANLFFARGVIIVEGDAENILIPTIAEIIEKPLHEYGVSIVNVGSTAYKRYAKIFLRKDKDDEKYSDDWLNVPVSIITDKDKKEVDEVEKLKEQLNKQNNEVFIPLHRTLEYDILQSDLKDEFIKAEIIANKIRNAEKRGYDYYKELMDENDKTKFTIPVEVDEAFTNLDNDKLDADYNYEHYFINNNASKAITAEIFCEILKQNETIAKQALMNRDENNPLKYLVDAINHVSKTNITV